MTLPPWLIIVSCVLLVYAWHDYYGPQKLHPITAWAAVLTVWVVVAALIVLR